MRISFAVCALLGFAACGGGKAADSGLIGVCAQGCPTGLVCQAGQCVSPCAAAGGLLCGTLCVNPLNDNANCGQCAVACPSGQICSAGACATSCAAGYTTCHPDAGPYCANLAGDVYNCGSCGNTCPAQDTCSAGACRAGSCPFGQTLCGADGGHPTCADLQGDNNNCGTCGKACSGGESCIGGTCNSGPACTSGLTACGLGDGGVECVDAQLDPDNCGGCGNLCGSDGICRDGACACPGIYTRCGSAPALYCAALQLDLHNCGGCGYSCVRCESCITGSCTPKDFFFAPYTPLPNGSGFNYYGPLALADFNRDGYLDVAVAGSSSTIAILNGGDGGFANPTFFFVGDSMTTSISVLAAGDLNGDGVPDLAVGFAEQGDAGNYNYYPYYNNYTEVAVYFGDGDGGFSLPDGGLSVAGPFLVLGSSDYLVGIVVADLNGDGLKDFVVLGSTSGLTAFYQTAGGFTEATIPTYLDAGPYPAQYASLAGGDLNGDGRTDLAVGAGYASPLVGALLATDTGFTAVTPVAEPTGNFQSPILVIGPDGLLNVLADQLRTYRYGAASGLVDVGDFAFPSYVYAYYGQVVGVADLNGDGQPDLAAGNSYGLAIWLRNDGGYDAPALQPSPVVSYVGGLVIAAVNGDSRPDIVFTTYYSYGGGVLRNNSGSCSP
jgi:hypothetical protein